MGSSCFFMRQRALKMGYFYYFYFKNSNHLHIEFSLGYPKDTKFYLESKASSIDISGIISIKPFLIAWLREYCTFFGQFHVWLEVLALTKIHPVGNYFPKEPCSTVKLFFFFKYVLY